MPKKHSSEEIVTSGCLKKRLKMREEKVCSMSKESDSCKKSLKERWMKWEPIMKNILQPNNTMNSQLMKLRNWSNSCKESEGQPWQNMILLIERFNRWSVKKDNFWTRLKGGRAILTNIRGRIRRLSENIENLRILSMRWVERATWMRGSWWNSRSNLRLRGGRACLLRRLS